MKNFAFAFLVLLGLTGTVNAQHGRPHVNQNHGPVVGGFPTYDYYNPYRTPGGGVYNSPYNGYNYRPQPVRQLNYYGGYTNPQIIVVPYNYYYNPYNNYGFGWGW